MAQRYVVKRKNAIEQRRSSDRIARAHSSATSCSGPVDAAASDAIRTFRGVFGASSGKMMIHAHSHGMPVNFPSTRRMSGKPRQNWTTEIPSEPTTSKTSPRSSSRCGGSMARLDSHEHGDRDGDRHDGKHVLHTPERVAGHGQPVDDMRSEVGRACTCRRRAAPAHPSRRDASASSSAGARPPDAEAIAHIDRHGQSASSCHCAENAILSFPVRA